LESAILSKLIAILLSRPLGTLTGCICAVILGAFALYHLPVNLYPHTEFPVLTVTTDFFEASPEEVETLITKPLEDAFADIPGLRRIQSSSDEGESRITLQFHYGQNISERALEVRSRLRRVIPSLPRDARFPVINRYDPGSSPVIVLAVAGTSSEEEAGTWVNRNLKPRLSTIEGVASVRVSGAPRPQIIADCDSGRLRASGLTIGGVNRTVREGHHSMPAGYLTLADRRIPIMTEGKFCTPEDVSQHPVKTTDTGSTVKAGEVAGIKFSPEEPHEITRYNGSHLITVAIYKAPDVDVRAVWRSVQERLRDLDGARDGVPAISVIFNEAVELEAVLQRAVKMMALTSAVTAFVLFVFLRSIAATLVVLSAVPFSLFLAVLLMKIFGVGLDLLSIGGLMLGLGILVDNSIVVVESISKKWEEGFSSGEGVVAGTEEVLRPLMLSTLATVIVFIPVVFISREVRLFFVGFTWTVVGSLVASLIASLILIPVLYRYLGPLTRARFRESTKLRGLAKRYQQVLSAVDNRKIAAFACLAVFLVAGSWAATRLSYRQGFATELRQFRIMMALQPGSSKEHTAKAAAKVEEKLLSLPAVKGVHSEIHGNQAGLTVSLKERNETEKKDILSMGRLREIIGQQPGTQIHVVPVGQQRDETKILLKVHGPGTDRLRELQEPVRQALTRVPGVIDAIILHKNPAPVVEFVLNQDELGFRHVRAQDVAHHVRSYFTGPVAARIFSEERIVNVRVRASRDKTEGLAPLSQSVLFNDRGQPVPFTELVKPSVTMEPGERQRENRQPVMRSSVVLAKDADPLTVVHAIRTAIERMQLPPRYDYAFGDEVQDIVRVRQEMMTAVGLGLVLVYLVLIAATESFLQPFFIMAAVPLGAVSAASALYLLGIPVSLPVYVGFMILCGLIVNVNVVMVYTINRMRREGQSVDEAVANGAQRRLRAILMTVATTVGASLPLFLDQGPGSSIWSPFALTLASGMAVSGILSLALTPVLYKTLETTSAWVGSKLSGR